MFAVADEISMRYIRLAFALEQHIPGYVDAYFGPPELREVEPYTPERLRDELGVLLSDLRAGSYTAQRKRFMEAQVRAMLVAARKLAGEALSYRDEVAQSFDIEPQHTPENLFDEALERIDALLPGQGSLIDRIETYRKQFEVSPEVAQGAISRVSAVARERTYRHTGLPSEENVEFVLVSDKPWSGYNWYLGSAKSRVEINTDLPIRLSNLIGLVSHESYPGHHTEHTLKEYKLYRERGYGEHAIQLINTPECIISEGIAVLAEEMIFSFEERQELLYDICKEAGLTVDLSLAEPLATASAALRAVSANVGLLIFEQGKSEDEALAYLMKYGLATETQARHRLRFITDPLWRTYVFTYHVGRDLLRRWIKRGAPWIRFGMLLTEQVTPSEVEKWVLEEESQCLG